MDDGSTDASKERLLKWKDEEGVPSIRVLTQSAKGLSAGRQWAVEEARGEWVAITDIDVRPEPDWIETMVAETKPIADGESIVAVTGRTVFAHDGDVVSRVRSVGNCAEIPCSASKNESCERSLLDVPTVKLCSDRLAVSILSGTMPRTWKSVLRLIEAWWKLRLCTPHRAVVSARA